MQAVINIAKARNMTTTAEGVETEQQREMLLSLGCTEMQGYLFSPARPVAEIRRLLTRGEQDRRGLRRRRSAHGEIRLAKPCALPGCIYSAEGASRNETADRNRLDIPMVMSSPTLRGRVLFRAEHHPFSNSD